MLEDENEQKYPFLLVFLQFCGLRGTSKYMSLADVRSAISKSQHVPESPDAEISFVFTVTYGKLGPIVVRCQPTVFGGIFGGIGQKLDPSWVHMC